MIINYIKEMIETVELIEKHAVEMGGDWALMKAQTALENKEEILALLETEFSGDFVRIPKSAVEAKAMILLGEKYLKDVTLIKADEPSRFKLTKMTPCCENGFQEEVHTCRKGKPNE